MTEIASAERRPLLRRWLSGPWLWALLCLVTATAILIAADDLVLPGYLLMLGGGWLCGFGFVNATLRMPAPSGVLVHLCGAVGAGGLLLLLASPGDGLSARAPEVLRAAVVVMQMAAAPAAGWIWLGLLGRATSAIGRRDASKAPERVVPGWLRDGDRSVLRFAAIPLRMRALTWAIVGIVVVLGAVATWALVATGDLAERLGPRLLIVGVGLVLVLPAYLVLRHVLRLRTVDAVLTISADRLRADAGDIDLDVALEQIDRLLWRTDSDYARVEVRAAAAELTLNAGLARVPAGAAPRLPELPRHVRRRLELAGFTPCRPRQGVVIYRRST
ncbi:hypothetical protein [Microbacterium tumbae]